MSSRHRDTRRRSASLALTRATLLHLPVAANGPPSLDGSICRENIPGPDTARNVCCALRPGEQRARCCALFAFRRFKLICAIGSDRAGYLFPAAFRHRRDGAATAGLTLGLHGAGLRSAMGGEERAPAGARCREEISRPGDAGHRGLFSASVARDYQNSARAPMCHDLPASGAMSFRGDAC
jgi:hypothetical protein